MNHINWIQQNEDYNVKYHVLKWKSSHFHEPYSSHVSSGAKISQGGAAASVPAAQTQAEGEGLGFATAERGGNARLRLGFGLEESLARNISGGENGRDGVSISARGMAVQEGMGETSRAAMQSMALAETHAAENTVTAVTTGGPEQEEREQEQAEKEKPLSRSQAGEVSATVCRRARLVFGRLIRGRRKKRQSWRFCRSERRNRSRKKRREQDRLPTWRLCSPCRRKITICWIPMTLRGTTVCWARSKRLGIFILGIGVTGCGNGYGCIW